MAETKQTELKVQATSEILGPCKRSLKIELPSTSVDEEFERVIAEYVRLAQLPGFRPGRAPRPVVEKRFAKEIEEEVRRALIGKVFREAVKQQSLHPVGMPEVKDVQFGRGKPLAFSADIEVEPEFTLPDYKGIPVRKPPVTVTEEDVQGTLTSLAGQRAQLEDVTGRPLAMEDFAVINFTAVSDGQPLAFLAPEAKALADRQNLLLLMGPQSFVPGFCEQLVGAAIGEKRQVQVDFPSDFGVQPLAGRKATYFVDVIGIKSKKLPPIDDALAASFAKDLTLEKLKERIRADLERERERAANTEARNQVIEFLLGRTTVDLPPGMLAAETRQVIQDVVSENTSRGISREAILEKKDEIFQVASRSATDRLKVMFILRRIGDQEKIEVAPAEIDQRVSSLSARYKIPYPKLRKQLEDRGGLDEIEDELRINKVLEFLLANASISTP